MTVHSFERNKLLRQNMMNDVRLFSRVLVLGNSMRFDYTTVPSPHGKLVLVLQVFQEKLIFLKTKFPGYGNLTLSWLLTFLANPQNIFMEAFYKKYFMGRDHNEY